MLQWYWRNSEGTSKLFTETQFSSGKGKRQKIFRHMALKRLSSIITYFYSRRNFQLVTHSDSGIMINETLVRCVGFSNRNGESISRHNNAGSCDFHKLIAAKPLDLKGYDGHLNCTEWEHSKLWCKLWSLCNWSFTRYKTAIAGLLRISGHKFYKPNYKVYYPRICSWTYNIKTNENFANKWGKHGPCWRERGLLRERKQRKFVCLVLVHHFLYSMAALNHVND